MQQSISYFKSHIWIFNVELKNLELNPVTELRVQKLSVKQKVLFGKKNVSYLRPLMRICSLIGLKYRNTNVIWKYFPFAEQILSHGEILADYFNGFI